jgi:hypothetical protein
LDDDDPMGPGRSATARGLPCSSPQFAWPSIRSS